MIHIKQLSFQYQRNQNILENISLNIHKGEICCICGKSGSGKTTLLRLLKKELKPQGIQTGSININHQSIEDYDSLKIGFVFQNPDTQIVNDYVYHELAFGLENLGIEYYEMHNRVAEIVQYFHLEDIYDKHTYELSGGQKQLVNLASVMIMQPDILLLDEPLASLDSKGRNQFVDELKRIRNDFNITIVMVSHQLDEILDIVDHMVILEKGKIKYQGIVKDIVKKIKDEELFEIFPEYIQLLELLNLDINLPIYKTKNIINPLKSKERVYRENNTCIEIKHLYAGYNKDVLSDLNLKVNKQEIFCILGSNGSGKTTLLKCLSSTMKYKGKIKYNGKVGYLPQDPLLLINKDSVYEELYKNFDKDKVDQLVDYFEFNDLLDYHPYDLSGGQQHILALMKLLLNECDILLLDEPTKSIDPLLKDKLGKLLEKLIDNGITIICVSHDLEFVAKYGTMISLLFHSRIIEPLRPKEFFKNNYFYTTQLSKLTRDYNHIISLKDVML
jgi:energy-coupling factor transport system ATP-binding protein